MVYVDHLSRKKFFRRSPASPTQGYCECAMTTKENSMPMQLNLRNTQFQKPVKDSGPEWRYYDTHVTQLFDPGGHFPDESELFDFHPMKE